MQHGRRNNILCRFRSSLASTLPVYHAILLKLLLPSHYKPRPKIGYSRHDHFWVYWIEWNIDFATLRPSISISPFPALPKSPSSVPFHAGQVGVQSGPLLAGHKIFSPHLSSLTIGTSVSIPVLPRPTRLCHSFHSFLRPLWVDEICL